MSSKSLSLENLHTITLIFSSLHRLSIKSRFAIWLGHYKMFILFAVKIKMLLTITINLRLSDISLILDLIAPFIFSTLI